MPDLRRIASSVLLSGCVASTLLAARNSAELNPTVKVSSRPSTAVPSDCDEGLVAAPPRIEVAQIPEPVEQPAMEAPPANDLRSALGAAQSAAERGSRDEFNAAVAGAQGVLAAYPAGGERNAAAAVLQVYKDLARLWTYEYENAAGGFFDASTEGGALLKMLTAYPEYIRYIAPETLSVGETTVYPSRESRRFLTEEAAQRLARLSPRGGSSSTGSTGAPATTAAAGGAGQSQKPGVDTRASRTTTSKPASTGNQAPRTASNSPSARSSSAVHASSSTRRSAAGSSTAAGKPAGSAHGSAARKHSPAKVPASHATSSSRHHAPKRAAGKTAAGGAGVQKAGAQGSPLPAPVSKAPASTPAPAVSSSSMPPASAAGSSATPSSSTAAMPSPAVSAPATTSTGSTTSSAVPEGNPLPAGETASGSASSTGTGITTSTAGSTTVAGDTVGAATSSTNPVPAPSSGRSVIVPIVLIVVGLGVLILLFRASS